MNDSDILNALESHTASIVPKNGLKERLIASSKEKRPLIIKLGCDPTAPDLHLGHAVVLKKLRQFQEFGHEIHLIIGDATALIGDPTGRNATRPPLTETEIKANAQTYVAQLGKVLDTSKVTVHFNSEWLGKLGFADIIKLMGKVTLAQLLERNDFTERYKANVPIAMHELVYPIMQGYDSVAIQSDIELGGTDQLFNCLMGKTLQAALGTKSSTGALVEQAVISMPLLRGLDGKDKMSKSKKNYIGLNDAPNDMYIKTMQVPDDLIEEFIELATNFDDATKAALKIQAKSEPMLVKKEIALNIVTQYHNAKDAESAAAFFVSQVQSRNDEEKEYLGIDVSPDISNKSFIDVITVVLEKAGAPSMSKSEIQRLFESGGIKINSEKAESSSARKPFIESVQAKSVKIQIGKKYYFEVRFK